MSTEKELEFIDLWEERDTEKGTLAVGKDLPQTVLHIYTKQRRFVHIRLKTDKPEAPLKATSFADEDTKLLMPVEDEDVPAIIKFLGERARNRGRKR